MKVIVYVEGPSDKLAMEVLLAPLLEEKRKAGVAVEFFHTEGKRSLLTKIPRRAANIVRNQPDSIVVAVPDLYPKNIGFNHETLEDLRSGMIESYRSTLHEKYADYDQRIEERFQVFCFKHDLESLVLACEQRLRQYLGTERFSIQWHRDVEEQDDKNPPKKIVEQLFRDCGKRYVPTVDAPAILAQGQYEEVSNRCSQCFKPFVEFLAGLRPEQS
ncbi:MAG: DUF4276 family protein [bacterium]